MALGSVLATFGNPEVQQAIKPYYDWSQLLGSLGGMTSNPGPVPLGGVQGINPNQPPIMLLDPRQLQAGAAQQSVNQFNEANKAAGRPLVMEPKIPTVPEKQYDYEGEVVDAMKPRKGKKKAPSMQETGYGALPRPGAMGLALLADILTGGRNNILAQFVQGHAGARQQKFDQEMKAWQQSEGQADEDYKANQQIAQFRLGRADRAEEISREASVKQENADYSRWNQAQSQYASANTPAEKEVAFRRLQAMSAHPKAQERGWTAPSQEAFDMERTGLQSAGRKAAIAEWNAGLKGLHIKEFGEVKPAAIAQAKALRAEIAARYKGFGITEETLLMPPSGLTWKKERAQELSRQWTADKKLRNQRFSMDLAYKVANVQMARQRIALAEQNGNYVEYRAALAEFNANLAALREARLRAETGKKKNGGEIDKINVRIAGIRAQRALAEQSEDEELIAESDQEIARLEAEKAAIKAIFEQEGATVALPPLPTVPQMGQRPSGPKVSQKGRAYRDLP